MKKIKRIVGYTALTKFFAECEETEREIPRVVPSASSSSPTHVVYKHNGQEIIVVETAHRRYDVFSIGEDR